MPRVWNKVKAKHFFFTVSILHISFFALNNLKIEDFNFCFTWGLWELSILLLVCFPKCFDFINVSWNFSKILYILQKYNLFLVIFLLNIRRMMDSSMKVVSHWAVESQHSWEFWISLRDSQRHSVATLVLKHLKRNRATFSLNRTDYNQFIVKVCTQ